jgi:hypothetical protein
MILYELFFVHKYEFRIIVQFVLRFHILQFYFPCPILHKISILTNLFVSTFELMVIIVYFHEAVKLIYV